MDQAQDQDFGSKSRHSLTHPVTLAAIAALLVNDWLFKAWWQHDWTTGKLSDLAWVIFASPLLAFLLSFFVRRTPLGQRAAFVVAYVGLPLLYLLFNTFETVNGAALRVLTLGLANVSHATPDPTDSLVIPLGLAVAFCVWFKRGKMRPRANWLLARLSGWPRPQRQTLSYTVAVVAIVASLASSPPYRDPGVDYVWLMEDGRLGARGSFHIWTSSDGGLTWNEGDRETNYSGPLQNNEVETPRGLYEIKDSTIVLTSDQGQGVAYDASFFESSQNLRIQEVATRNLEARHLFTRPLALAYHPGTGNVVAAMGIQGVLMGTPDGLWTPVAVGPYQPTDFSISGRMLYLVGDTELLLMILALGVAFTAVAISVTSQRQTARRKTVLLGVIGLVSWLAFPILVTIFSTPLSLVPLPGIWLTPPVFLLVIGVLAFFLVQRRVSEKDWADSCNDLAVILASASVLPAFLALLSINGNVMGEDLLGIIPGQIFPITALSCGLLALVLNLPRVKDLPYIAAGLAGTSTVAYFGFLIGIPQVGLGLTKALALALAIVAALGVLIWRSKTVPRVKPSPRND